MKFRSHEIGCYNDINNGKEECKRKTFECYLNNVQPSENYDNTNTDNILLDGSLNTKHRGFIKTSAVPPKCDKLVNDCKALKPPVCEKSLDEISFWNNYHMIKCPADGHCFVHATVYCWIFQFWHDRWQSYQWKHVVIFGSIIYWNERSFICFMFWI